MLNSTSTANLASLRLIVLDAYNQGSDTIYLQPGRSPFYHLNSKLVEQDHLAPLTPGQFEHYLREVLAPEQLECYRTHQKLDAQVYIPNIFQAQVRCGLTAQGKESMSLSAIVLENVNLISQGINTQEVVEKLPSQTIATEQVVRAVKPARYGWEEQFRLTAQGDNQPLDTTMANLTTWDDDEWEW